MADKLVGDLRRELAKTQTDIRAWVITLASVAIGAAIVIVAGTARETLDRGVIRWYDLLVAIGSSVMGVGVLALIFEVSLRRQLTHEVLTAVQLGNDLVDAGVSSIPADRKLARLSATEHLAKANDIDLIYIAASWLEQNVDELTERLKGKAPVRLRILMPDPENLEIIRQIYDRFSYKKLSLLQSDIEIAANAAQELQTLFPTQVYGGVTTGVELRWLPIAPIYSLFRVGTSGVMEFYQMAKDKSYQPPILIFQSPGTVATFAKADFEALWNRNDPALAKGLPS